MRSLSFALAFVLLITAAIPCSAAVFLFDATKAEMAGNADWVIDADLHNLKISAASDGSGTPGAGSESNPQRYPTPAASGITANTAETYWEGALSAWAVDLVKHGHSIETLPYNGHITYKDGTNPQDLTNYNVFVLVEPNILFTATEKAAIVSFVHDGGGLFIVSDHGASDRNNDGADAVQVLNALMTNSVANNPFGISFNGDNLTGDFAQADSNASDPITHGPTGTGVDFPYNNGSSITINTAQNSSARIAMWSSSTHGNNNGVIVYATYGSGKVVASGDSSPFDDGTGDPGDSLFFSQGYADSSTTAGILILNASLWLATQPVPVPTLQITNTSTQIQIAWPTPSTGFSLQTSTNLSSTNNWSAVTNSPANSGSQFVVALPMSPVPQYFRLRK